MLTQQMLIDMKPFQVFKEGRYVNGDENFYWQAQRGGIDDWAVYYTTIGEHPLLNGAKLISFDKIRILVPCTNEAFEHYRL